MLTRSCAFIFLPLFTNVRQCKVITCLGRDSCESILCQLVHVARLHLKLNCLIISGRGGSAGAKFRISLGLPVGAVINCADNTGKKQITITA